MKRAACFGLVLLVLLACKSGDDRRGSPTPGGTRTPPLANAKPSPAIPDVSVGQNADAQRVDARLLLSRVTPAEAIPMALRVGHAPGRAPKKGISIPLNWSETVGSLTLTVTRGSESVKLTLAAPPAPMNDYLPAVHDLAVSGKGIELFKKLLPWKNPKNDLFETPGRYSLRLAGTIGTSSKPTFDIGPLEIEIKAPADDFKSVVDLERVARKAASGPVTTPVSARSPAVEDAAGNRWFRYTRFQPSNRYNIDVIEVLVSPAGKVVTKHEFRHFTCVAAGTSIATPRGPVLVEQLGLGDEVWGWDTEKKAQVATPVRAISRASSDTFVSLGGLLVTPEHPIYAAGKWTLAGQLGPEPQLQRITGESVVVRRDELARSPRMVIDLSVGWPHNFFAGGFLVHNKAVHVPIGGHKNPWRGLFNRGRAGASQ